MGAALPKWRIRPPRANAASHELPFAAKDRSTKKWLVRVVEGRYRCWDDFRTYGMLSTGHRNPPADPLRLLSRDDEVYAFLPTRGYVGHGVVTQPAVLAGQFVVYANFVYKDGSGSADRAKLTEILLLKRSDMREDADDPVMGEWVVGVRWRGTVPRTKCKQFSECRSQVRQPPNSRTL